MESNLQRPKRVVVLFGTRPEAIKMAPVVHELRRQPEAFETLACTTGQHREMLDEVLDTFDITPAHDLDVMQPNQTLPALTARLITRLSELFQSLRPDLVLVHGDTTTALAGALAAYYERVPIGHVEAGLRTYDRYQPFPEEMNRHLVDVLSVHHFAPTERAREHLLREGVAPEGICVTGNTVIDALHLVLKKPHPLPVDLDPGRKLLLVTAHRRENFGEALEHICHALLRIAERHPELEVVYPVHYNPNVREPVFRLLRGHDRIHLIDPLGYAPFVHLMAKAHIVLTDSGGIQEEAPGLGVPVLVMREVTERPEAVEAGTVRMVGTDVERIASNVTRLMDPAEHAAMAQAVNPYGDGQAAPRIASALNEAVPA